MSNDKLITVDDYEKVAHDKLTQNAWNYYASGADGEQTLGENKSAFDRLRIRPHMLRGISKVDTKVTVLGRELDLPIFLAPVGIQGMAHPEGEIATVKAADAYNVLMAVSTGSSTPFEEVSKVAPNAFLLMQLYVYQDKVYTIELIRRAEKTGFKGIALTIDTPILGRRTHKSILPKDLLLANHRRMKVQNDLKSDNSSGLTDYVLNCFEPELSPDTIKWLKSVTDLPIYVKGILTGEDAKSAVEMGVQGIIVSNHGGRQLDGVPSTIEALPEVVAAVGGTTEIFLDGGIRRGTDVFKALALGAKGVFIGRPLLWGLAHSGEQGVRGVLKILKEEFERTMILSGCANISEIVPSMVVHESYYWQLPNPRF